MKEAKLEWEFCKDIFGDDLGYTLFYEGKDQLNLQQKCFANVVHADAAIHLVQATQSVKCDLNDVDCVLAIY